MWVSRYSLQAKMVLLMGATVVLVVVLSTGIALWLTREPDEEPQTSKTQVYATYFFPRPQSGDNGE